MQHVPQTHSIGVYGIGEARKAGVRGAQLSVFESFDSPRHPNRSSLITGIHDALGLVAVMIFHISIGVSGGIVGRKGTGCDWIIVTWNVRRSRAPATTGRTP